MFKSPILKIALAILLISSLFSCKKTEIKLLSPFKQGHILCDTAAKFKEIVEKNSKGKILVQIQLEAGTEEAVNAMLNEGKTEMLATGHQALQNYANQYFFINAPFVIKDFDHFVRVWDGKLGTSAKDLVAKNGNMYYIGIVNRGLRQTTSLKPINSPADVKGLKLRLPVVPAWVAVWKALGADTVTIPLPELYEALKTKKAQASEGDLPQISAFKLNEVQSNIAITNHLVQTGGILINKTFFDKLSKKNQDLILAANKEACDWANQFIKDNESKILEDLKSKGMKATTPDANAFRDKAKDAVLELFKKDWSVTTWDEVLAQ